MSEQAPAGRKSIKRYFPFQRLTVNELVDYCIQNNIDPDAATFGGGQLIWETPETDAEYERRRQFQAERDLRHERWERDMFDRLLAKFGQESS